MCGPTTIVIIGNPLIGYHAYKDGIEVDYENLVIKLEKERLALKQHVDEIRGYKYGECV